MPPQGMNWFKRAYYVMRGRHAFIQVYNGKQGDPTVLRCYFPGHTFDGTSCFNLGKELVARYYGERSEVVVQTELTEKADAALRSQSFLGFLAKMPFNVLVNTSDFTWMFATSMRVLGGPGMSLELALVNLDENDSARLVAGLKRRGIKPFAGFIYAAFHAYKGTVGANPYTLCQQASMQSRAYSPSGKISLEQFRKDRRFVGDWLIGVLHHFKAGDFTLEDAQAVYEVLLENLGDMKGNVAEAAMGKAYCPLGGAAVFQFFPFLSQNMRVMDSIFFNNVGLSLWGREVSVPFFCRKRGEISTSVGLLAFDPRRPGRPSVFLTLSPHPDPIPATPATPATSTVPSCVPVVLFLPILSTASTACAKFIPMRNYSRTTGVRLSAWASTRYPSMARSAHAWRAPTCR